MSLVFIILMGCLVFSTAIISGVVGMAGGMVLLASMTFFFPLQTIIPLHGIIQLSSNLSRCFFLRRDINKEILSYFLMGAPLGTMGAYFLIDSIENKDIFFLLIVALIFYTLFKPKKLPPIHIPRIGFFPLGTLIGFAAPLVGATGPILAPFFLRDDLTKEEIVATKAAAQMFTHLLKVPLFIALAFPYGEYSLLLGIMILMAVLGTKCGVYLLGKVSQEIFVKVYKFALLISALRLLYKIFLEP